MQPAHVTQIKAASVSGAYVCRIQALRPKGSRAMSALVVAFPCSRAALMSTADGEWLCEAERDGGWGLSAIIVPSKPERHDYAAFLVSRCDDKLLLIDARLSAHWRRLGVFNDTEVLVLALAGIIHTTAVAPKRSA